MRVLIAPDKFKGSLTAAEVADHLAKGLAEAGAHARTLPLADGGDGSVAAALASGFHPLPVDVGGATGENHRGVVAFDLDTAIVALGYRFLDRTGKLVAPIAENLIRIHCIDSQHAVKLNGIETTVAGDVTSPLLGLTGAAPVFGLQKGATATQVAQLDAGLQNLVNAFTRSGKLPRRQTQRRGLHSGPGAAR